MACTIGTDDCEGRYDASDQHYDVLEWLMFHSRSNAPFSKLVSCDARGETGWVWTYGRHQFAGCCECEKYRFEGFAK